MKWYKTLNINTKINLKNNTQLICGIPYECLTLLFNQKEIWNMIYEKLTIVGFNI